MYIDRGYWEDLKKKFYERMIRDRYIGYLDPGIEEILIKIFRLKDAFPTSSCSGRIYAVDSDYPWARKGSYVVFKKHDVITLEEFRSLINIGALNTIWLIVSGPIIHINTYTSREALKILRIAREAGFKHSGVLSKSRRGYIVEIISGVHLDIPLKIRDKILIREEEASTLINKINRAFLTGRERLKRLSKLLDDMLQNKDLI